MTKITLETQFATAIIEVPKDFMNINEILDDLIKPVLLASGFHSSVVEEYLDKE